MPINYQDYPFNWKEIRARILERDGHRCKQCGVKNYSPLNNEKGTKVVLTISHYNHDITDNRDENLAALCQRCHLNHDKYHHSKNAKATRYKKKYANQGRLWDERNEDAFLSDT